MTKENFKTLSLTKKFMVFFYQKRMCCGNRVFCRCCNSVLQVIGQLHLYSFLAKDCRWTKSSLEFENYYYFNTSTHGLWETALREMCLKKTIQRQRTSCNKHFVGVKFVPSESRWAQSRMQQQPASPKCHILPLVFNSLNYSKSTEERRI